MRLLSVLSVGTGEINPSPSPRLDVRFDSKDFLNARRRHKGAILNPKDSLFSSLPYMPPPGLFNPRPPKMKREATLPKTYFTKKGDLFLYSEDLAGRNNQKRQVGSEKQLNISTADLTMAIARYEKSHGQYNRFYREGPEIRPGHSAKRHAAAWHLSHPEINICGSLGSKVFRKPDKHGRKRRIIRSSLSVFPPPYNMPKSLAQIKEGVKPEVFENGNESRESGVGVGILKKKNFDSGSSPLNFQRNKALTRLVRPSMKIPQTDEKSNKNVNFRSQGPPFEQERDSLSSASSGVKFTLQRLPPIFKHPSPNGYNVKKSINSSSASSSSPRKQVRIQLDPVVLPDPTFSDFSG